MDSPWPQTGNIWGSPYSPAGMNLPQMTWGHISPGGPSPNRELDVAGYPSTPYTNPTHPYSHAHLHSLSSPHNAFSPLPMGGPGAPPNSLGLMDGPMSGPGIPQQFQQPMSGPGIPQQFQQPMSRPGIPQQFQQPMSGQGIPQQFQQPMSGPAIPQQFQQPMGEPGVPQQFQHPMGHGWSTPATPAANLSAWQGDGGVGASGISPGGFFGPASASGFNGGGGGPNPDANFDPWYQGHLDPARGHHKRSKSKSMARSSSRSGRRRTRSAPGTPQLGMPDLSLPWLAPNSGHPSTSPSPWGLQSPSPWNLGSHSPMGLGVGSIVQWTPYTGAGEDYGPNDLARRPKDWRRDYSPRGGLAGYIPSLIGRRDSIVEDWTDKRSRTLDSRLLWTASRPPLNLDLRPGYNPFSSSPSDPFAPFPSTHTSSDTYNTIFTSLNRPYNSLDLVQLATTPAVSMMRLYHPLLPWFIDVKQTHPNGVTVQDVLKAVVEAMGIGIQKRHFWNEELRDEDREVFMRALWERCRGGEVVDVLARGICWVDFLGKSVVFEGLVRGRNGNWEMKTRRVGPE